MSEGYLVFIVVILLRRRGKSTWLLYLPVVNVSSIIFESNGAARERWTQSVLEQYPTLVGKIIHPGGSWGWYPVNATESSLPRVCHHDDIRLRSRVTESDSDGKTYCMRRSQGIYIQHFFSEFPSHNVRSPRVADFPNLSAVYCVMFQCKTPSHLENVHAYKKIIISSINWAFYPSHLFEVLQL